MQVSRYSNQPTTSAVQAARFYTDSRQQRRRDAVVMAMREINRIAGGEPRRIRRAMARDRAKYMEKAR